MREKHDDTIKVKQKSACASEESEKKHDRWSNGREKSSCVMKEFEGKRDDHKISRKLNLLQ